MGLGWRFLMNCVAVNFNNHDQPTMNYNEVWFNSLVLCAASNKHG